MISFYVTKSGNPFAVGKSKNDSFLTIGVRSDNDIVLTGVHAANRFLMIKIQGGILKVSCVDSVRGLKVNKASLSAGQEKLIPGTGNAPITLEDYVIYIKIGEANESWPRMDQLRQSVGLPDVEKTPIQKPKPQPTPKSPKSSSEDTDFFSATEKTSPSGRIESKIDKLGKIEKVGMKKETKKETETLFEDDFDDDFFTINGAGKSDSKKAKEIPTKDIAPPRKRIDEETFNGLFDSDDDDVISMTISKDSDNRKSDETKKEIGGLPEPIEKPSIVPMQVEEIVDESEVMEVSEMVYEVEVEEEVVELDEFGESEEKPKEETVGAIDSVSDKRDDNVPVSSIAKEQVEKKRKRVMRRSSVSQAPQAPAEQIKSKPQKKSKEMRPVAPAPATMASVAERPAPPSETKVVKDIERKTTVRYYEQMTINKNFPLLVVFSKEEIERIVQQDVAQVEGKEKVRVKKDKPVVNVVPQFPGCICVPERQEVDLTPENTEVTFWITPVAEGKLPAASVNVHYEGKIIQKIECPTRVAKSTATKVTASAAIISPVFFSAIESVGLDPKSQVETGFPVVKQISNWLEAQSSAMLGTPILSGMTLLGLLIGLVAFIAAIIFFIKSRPKEGDPVGEFLNFNFTKTLE